MREQVVGERVYETRKFPVKLSDGNFGVGSIIRDITHMKISESKLKENEEKLYATLLSVGDGVIAVDNDGKVEFLNPIAQKLT